MGSVPSEIDLTHLEFRIFVVENWIVEDVHDFAGGQFVVGELLCFIWRGRRGVGRVWGAGGEGWPLFLEPEEEFLVGLEGFKCVEDVCVLAEEAVDLLVLKWGGCGVGHWGEICL